MFIDKRCANTYAVHWSFQLERRIISVIIFNFLSISPVSQGRLDKENKNGNEAKYIGSSLRFKIDHIRFCTRIEFAVRISYKTRLIVNGDISLIELSLTTTPTGILILKQHDNNVSLDLPHAMLNVYNFYDIRLYWFISEDDSTPVRIAMRCLNPACVRYQYQRAHYTYSVHKM